MPVRWRTFWRQVSALGRNNSAICDFSTSRRWTSPVACARLCNTYAKPSCLLCVRSCTIFPLHSMIAGTPPARYTVVSRAALQVWDGLVSITIPTRCLDTFLEILGLVLEVQRLQLDAPGQLTVKGTNVSGPQLAALPSLLSLSLPRIDIRGVARCCGRAPPHLALVAAVPRSYILASMPSVRLVPLRWPPPCGHLVADVAVAQI